MEYLSFVCQSSSLLPWPPSLGGYNLLQLRPHLWMNVISPQRCFLGRKVYQDSQHMKGEGIQGKICLSSWGLYPLILRKVPCNLPVIYSTNMGGHFLVFLIRTFKWTFFVSVMYFTSHGFHRIFLWNTCSCESAMSKSSSSTRREVQQLGKQEMQYEALKEQVLSQAPTSN